MPLTDSIRLSFGFRDVRGLVANFHQADVRAQREIRRAVKDAGDFFLDLGYFLAPVDSSWMRDHLRARYSDDGLVFEGGYRSEDFVGRYVERTRQIILEGERVTDPNRLAIGSYSAILASDERTLVDGRWGSTAQNEPGFAGEWEAVR